MSTYRIKKVVALCFLEAAKTALDQLGQYRIELSNQGMEPPRDLATFYGDVRRTRDYLQCCVGAYPDVVELELDKEGKALLVACAIRAVEFLDFKLENGRQLSDQEREWLERKRQVLSNWAVEFAEHPLLTLPLPKLSPTPTRGVEVLASRLQEKVRGLHIGKVETRGRAETTEQAPVQPASAPGSGPAPGPPPMGSVPGKIPASLAPQVEPKAPEAEAEEAASDSGPLMDPRQIRDPRLRTLLTLDLRAYERAVDSRDHRLASVHLASVLEGAMLDYALPRSTELGLVGSPDTWDPQEVLLRVLGEEPEPKDRMMVHQVFQARNLVRPMVQLLQPTVVTPASLEKMAAFVRQALWKMGFKGAAKVDP